MARVQVRSSGPGILNYAGSLEESWGSASGARPTSAVKRPLGLCRSAAK